MLVGVNKRTVAHLSITVFQILSEREIAGKGGKVLERKKATSEADAFEPYVHTCRIIYFKKLCWPLNGSVKKIAQLSHFKVLRALFTASSKSNAKPTTS